jgi:predicted CXXCH cytochrome family protein
MRIRQLALGLGLVVAVAALAADAPHDASSVPTTGCTTCHTMHNAPGGSLTNTAGAANLCASCHSKRSGVFGFPWTSSDQAIPSLVGNHHRWDAPADSPSRGASVPLNAEMSIRIEKAGGDVSCGICHDVHSGAKNFPAGSTQHLSVTLGAPLARLTGAGTGTVAVTSVGATALAKGYTIRIALGGAVGTATFQVSNDNGTSWWGWDPLLNGGAGGWATARVAGRPIPLDGVVALNDPNVVVTFSGSFVGGTPPDRFQGFYVSYPALRMANGSGEMCEDCHRSWVQTALRVEGNDPAHVPDGVNVFSHPTGPGVTLSKPYDRTQGANGAILEPSGVEQGGAGDGIRTNDLVLYGGEVRCLTCHYPHNSDSNGLTEDIR